jgi:hypothetical protein
LRLTWRFIRKELNAYEFWVTVLRQTIILIYLAVFLSSDMSNIFSADLWTVGSFA